MSSETLKMSPWMQTASGKQFWPLDPKPSDVDRIDIAHALGMKCRFGGHCQRFYSIGEHSLRVAKIVPAEFSLHALLHDAAEAYLPDVIAPIKKYVAISNDLDVMPSAFQWWEMGVMGAIYQHFGIEWPSEECEAAIHHADLVMLATEARDIMGKPPAPWVSLPEPLAEGIGETLNPVDAKAMFLDYLSSVGAAGMMEKAAEKAKEIIR